MTTGPYNRFGATYDQVVALYPGAVVADLGGQAAVESVLDRITREVSGALTVDVYRLLTDFVELELVEPYASAGETAFNVGLTPIVSSTLHLWRFGQFDDLSYEPVFGVAELTVTSFNIATGAIVIADGTQISKGARVFASYRLDSANASFSWPSVADVVKLGAAAELGAAIYSQADQSWQLVTEYRDRYRGALGASVESGAMARARKGDWVPDEVRGLRWWSDIERTDEKALGSVRRYRA